MSKTLYRLLGCAILLMATALNVNAENGIIETRYYRICAGDMITPDVHQNRIYHDTIVYDTLHVTDPTQDSIYEYVVNVYPVFYKEESREVEYGTVFEWRGIPITTTGRYERVYKTEHDCDSTFVLQVTERKSTQEKEVRFSICDDETLTFNGNTYSEAGTYYSPMSEDSVYKIIITKYPSQTYVQQATLDATRPYIWQYMQDGDPMTDTIAEPGIYEHTTQNPETGCNDTWRLILTRDETGYHFQEYKTICENEEFSWRGKEGLNHQNVGQTTHYLDKYRTKADQDSIYELILTVLPVSRTMQTVPFCGSIQWKDKTITETVTFIDTLSSTRYSCDSIVTITFQKGVPFHKHDTVTIVPGETLYWRGQTIQGEGLYEDRYVSLLGCDSLYTLGVGMKAATEPMKMRTYYESICQGDEFEWRNKTYYNQGTYVDTTWTATNEIDSLYVLLLTVNPTYAQTERVAFPSFPVMYRGQQIDAPGVYPFLYHTGTGCDSLITTTIDREITRDEQTVTVCYGDVYTWFGRECKENNRYVYVEPDQFGRDSVEHVLNLTVVNLPDQYLTATICRGNTYTFYDRTLTEGGEYTYESFEQGCRQLIHLSLNVLNSDTTTDVVHINPGETYTWPRDNKVYQETGVYFDYGHNRLGCDSIGILILTVNHVDTVDSTAIICAGETIEWHGIIASQTGDYTHADQLANGAYNYYRLHLTVREQVPDFVRHLYACGDGATLTFDGQTYTKDTMIVAHYQSVLGCDSVEKVFMHFNTSNFYSDTVTITNQQLPYTWHFQLPGERQDTLLTTSGTFHHKAPGDGSCFDLEELVLIINPSYLIEERVKICETDIPYYWANGPTDHQNEPLQHKPGTTMQYEYRLTSIFGTDSIYRLYLTIDTVEQRHETYYVCEGHPQTIYGKTYGTPGGQTEMIDHYVLNYSVPKSVCEGELTVDVYVSSIKQHTQTVILHDGESLDWGNYHITQGGTYLDTTKNVGVAGCDSISTLRVIQELREEQIICTIDTPDLYPYLWPQTQLTYNTSGIYTDTIFDADGNMTEFHSLYLTITQPYDTTVYVHGCKNKGAYWRDVLYKQDTTFIDRVPVTPFDPQAPCDSVFHVNIIMDTIYHIRIDTTLCEYQLPLIIGRVNPDTIWEEKNFQHRGDTTLCGCDSIIEGHLTIIPKLTHNDSTFACEELIIEHPVVLGDLDHPAFLDNDGGKWEGKWEGKWKGVAYHQDTIVWDCDHRYFHHIIVRPHQAQPKDTTYYLCEGDSVQLFWPKETMISKPGIYLDTVANTNPWWDTHHGQTVHNDQAYVCDSVVRWTVKYANAMVVDTVDKHIALGDSIWWGGRYCYFSGYYDSICDSREGLHNSDMQYCQEHHWLHLYADTIYRYNDTITICHTPGREYTYRFADGQELKFITPDKDTAMFHVKDSVKPIAIDFYDHYYDLMVYYKKQYLKQIVDTICEGAEYRFDIHRNNTTIERWLTKEGTYRDTLEAMNGCDSIIELRLRVRYRNTVTHQTVMITDREIPYLWSHTWKDANGQDTTAVDTLRSSGEYRFLMPSIHGCDSVDSLHFSVHQTHVFRDTISVCSDPEKTHTHLWATGYEQTFTVPTTDSTLHYCDTLQTRITLDSIYALFVHYSAVTYTYVDSNLCYGDSMRFGLTRQHLPRFIKQSGEYRDTLVRNVNGCDSIIVLRLNVFPHYLDHKTVDIASDKAPYVWPHIQYGDTIASDTLRASGEYSYHFNNAYGCDSIDSLSLRIHQVYLFRDTVTLCYDQTPYEWEGIKDIYETGEYIKHLQTHDGYDSTLVRYVHVLPLLYTVTYDTICEGDSLRFGLTKQNKPRFLLNPGVYRDTLLSHQHGCDSIIELRLNVFPRYRNHQVVDVADVKMPYVWSHLHNGDTIASDTLRAAGGYSYTFQTIHGCDSIDSLTLRVHTTYLFHDTVTICQDQTPYTWFDRQDIYETGEYIKHLQTHDGYDSTYVRFIRVIPIPHDTIRYAMCEGADYLFNGVRYTQGGSYTDTLASTYGCDSIVTLLLTVNKPVYIRIPVDIYEGDSYEFYGEPYTTSGTYRHYAQTPEGCDSITELFLTVHPQIDTIVTVCSTDLPYLWVNKWSGRVMPLYQAGKYRNDTTYINGQRTFYTILLNVNEPKFDTIRHAMCEGASYEFKGNTYFAEGIYRDTLQAANGCDSIVTLILTVNKPYYNVIRENVLEGQSVDFYGQTYTTTGTFYHYAKTPEGCDSTTVLQLVVHPLVDTVVTICANDVPFIWNNRWSGKQEAYYRSGLYRNDTTINGEKRFYGLQVVVNDLAFDTIRHAMCEGASYEFKGNTYFAEGIYRDTLQAANGCDSIVTLILTVNKPYYNVIRENVLEGQSVDFYGQTYTTTGTFYHYAKTPEGCDSTTVLQLVVHPLVDTVVTICANDVPFIWNNRWSGKQEAYYRSGLYRNDTTINGEKRFYGLQLKVNLPSDTTIYRTVCEGTTYNFNGLFLTKAGEYRDTLRNAVGCDSVVVLHLNVLSNYYHSVERSIFEGDTVMFEGSSYSTAGIYPIRYNTANGCDSIIELRLNVYRLFDDSVSVCANDLPYTWRNKTIYESGIYRDTVVNTEGKETLIGLKVIVLPIAHKPEPIVATICDGDFYKFGETILTVQGTYYDTLTARNGCDSIVMLSLQVLPVRYQSEIRRIYEGDSVYFDGKWLKESGIYERRETNANNCTDTYQLILTVLKQFNIDTTAVICKNELPFIWRGYEYNESGDYTLPIAWTDSSRVVKTLHLTVNDNYYAEKNISICSGSTFIFKGRSYTESQIFNDTIPSVVGCDSIVRYIISVKPTYDQIDTVHISDKQSYNFYGRTLNQTGYYEHTERTMCGCDSIHHLYLVVHPSYFYTDTVDICRPDTFYWRGHEKNEKIFKLYESGVYYDSCLTTTFGFDSVYQIVVQVHPSYYLYEQYEIAEDQTLRIHGRDISKPGVYEDTLRSIYGCDSIYHIVVNLKRTMELTIVDSICQGDFYDFFGRRLSQQGKYINISDDKTVITTLILKVNPVSITEKRVVLTDKQDSYIYQGKLYDHLTLGTHIYTDTLQNTYNCDSIFRLIIVVTKHYSEWDQIPLCPGGELKIDGEVITEAGLYTFIRRSKVTGELDSLYRVEVYDAPAFDFPTEHRVICEGDTCFFGGKAITRGGHHDIELKTMEGCDSLLHLDLTVYPSYHFITDTTIVDYESVYWRGKTYSESGTYDRSWPTIHDCDSTYTLRLNVVQTIRDTVTKTICDGDSYYWRGREYTGDGFYSDTLRSIETYYSAIYSLRLIVVYPTNILTARTTEVCADDDSFDIEFEYEGAKPEFYNVYFDALAKREGFNDIINERFSPDMIVHIDLPKFTTVAYENDSESHPNYVRPDYYTMRLVLDNGVCGLSQSADLTLLVKYPSWIIQQNWDDVVAPLRSELNGNYKFVQYEWYVNGTRQSTNGLGYIHSDALQVGDEVVLVATREGENYGIPTCPLTIRPMAPNVNVYPVLVYPTKAPRYMPVVTLKAEQTGSYAIYSSEGILVSSGDFGQGEQTITLPALNGLWFIRTSTADGQSETHKVVIY